MTMLKRVLIVVAAVAVVFATAATTLDFSLARTTTNETGGGGVASAQNPGARRVCPSNRVFLHVEDREGLGGVLAWELRLRLQETCGFTVTLLNNAPGPDDFPLVLAGVRKDEGFWTPFYARRTVTALMKFSSHTSEFALDEKAGVDAGGAGPPGIVPVVVAANSTIESASTGMISLPAHRKAVFGDAVRRFAETLKRTIEAAEINAEQGAAP